ncbi:MAG TPA: T9SS type A sorting domain-containing protein [Bacteroidia bacterium]|jgi:hypothetical protein|nr:T9SS type A sorting domain-containing protein [Bacteroidia bacterium]
MKKILLLIFPFLFFTTQAQTWVTIPDTYFAGYLHTIVDSAMNGDQLDITHPLVTTTTHTINVYNMNITSVEGVQYFTSLTKLNCSGNQQITSLPALPSTLIELECSTNAISQLPALPDSLIYLDCGVNGLTSLPTLPASLTGLSCIANQLTSLPTLPAGLTGLSCFNNSLTSLPVLPSSLQFLTSHNNNITCFPTFPNSITTFSISSNPYNCLPNHIAAMSSADLATPLCAASNTNGCPVVDCTPALNFYLTKDTSQVSTWLAYPNYSANVTNAIWYWGDSTSTSGLYPSHTYSVAGKYNICVSAFSFCGDSVNVCQNDSLYRLANSTSSNMIHINVINNITAIPTFNKQHATFQIYPNPAQNIFTIETSSADKQTVLVFDVNGKQVLQQTINGTTNIDASNLSAGVYNISITNNQSTKNKRLVIVK